MPIYRIEFYRADESKISSIPWDQGFTSAKSYAESHMQTLAAASVEVRNEANMDGLMFRRPRTMRARSNG